jgi:carbon monoxide dehydrogenase subunit G
MNAFRRHFLWGLPALLLAPRAVLAQSDDPLVDESSIQVRRQGEVWIVEARFTAPVPPALAWAVLTDFDNMARIVSNLNSSRVVSRQGNVLQVEQKGRARFGLFSVAFESLREITLTPRRRIQARGLSGSAKQFESDMTLAVEGEGTVFTYRVDMVPDFWLPSLLGPSLLRHEMAEQFSALVAEMQRRSTPR